MLMLGKNESDYVDFHAEEHGKCPEHFIEVPNIFSLVTSEKSGENGE